MDRTKKHYQIIINYRENKDLFNIRHSAKECIHHSCSAILAYYGLFMGVSSLKPLYNLQHAIKLLLDSDPNKSQLLNYSKIYHIKRDLKAIDQSIKYFKVTLDKTIKILHSTNPSDIKHLINNAIEIYKIMKDLITEREETSKFFDSLNEDININFKIDFYNLCARIFNYIDGFKQFESQFDEDFISFRHNINRRLFIEIKPKIIIIPLFKNTNISYTDLKTHLNKLEMSNSTNTIIFITNKKYEISCLKYIKDEIMEKLKIILLRSFHLYDLFTSKNNLDKLEEIILRNYENISKGTFISRNKYFS